MWATQFNNFEVNKDKFPDFQSLVSNIHAQKIRVILWATSMINLENPDFAMAMENKFIVRNSTGGIGVGPNPALKWWHGEGGLLDYSNPKAVEYWHGLMDKVLVLPNGDGVDGFKCDGTDPYIMEYLLTGGK